MNLDKFRPAWSQVKVMHQFDPLSSAEILSIIEHEGQEAIRFSWERMARYAVLYSLLLICCQG